MRKIITFIGTLMAVLICVWITQGSNHVNAQSKLLNMIFLSGMLALCFLCWLCGIQKMNQIKKGFVRGKAFLDLSDQDEIPNWNELKFKEIYLDKRYMEYRKYRENHGNADIRDFINESDIGKQVYKRFLEVVPDILTSAGILGTFIGLVLGLRHFDPSGYQQMSSSMIPLIDGIKVAFITSIYGITLSLAYSFLFSQSLEEMEEKMEEFLEEFDFRNYEGEKNTVERLVNGQRQQTEILKELTESFTTQLADCFEEVITPTFYKLGIQIDQLSVNQGKIMSQMAEELGQQFQKVFLRGLRQFEENLKKINELQFQYIKFIDMGVQQINNSMNMEQNALKNGLKDMSEYFLQCTDQLQKTMSEQNAIVKDFKEISTEFQSGMMESVGNFQDQINKISTSTHEIIGSSQTYSEDLKKSFEVVENASQNIWQAAQGIQSVESEVRDICRFASESYQSAHKIAADIDSMAAQVQQYAANIEGSMNYIQKSMIDVTNISANAHEIVGESAKFQEETLKNLHEMQQVMQEIQDKYKEQLLLPMKDPTNADKKQEEWIMREMLREIYKLVEFQEKKKESLWKRIFRRD